MNATAGKQFEEDVEDVDEDVVEAGGAEVEVGEDDDLEIEVVDDTPEADKGRERRAEGVEPDIPDDDEVSKYSKNAQKRIKQLTWEFHEERRRAEEQERLAREATDFARRQHEALKRYQTTLQSGEKDLVDNSRARYQAELAAAKAAYAKAFEEGDAEKVADAQERMARAASAAATWDSYQPRYQQPPQQAQPQYRQPQPQPVQQPQQIDETTREWRDRNQWFGKDRLLSAAAMAIHEDLAMSGQVRVGSPTYYDMIDKRMREEFPQKFNGSGRQRASDRRQPVAPVARSSPGARKRVSLTQTQVALAKKLGLTPKQYAEQVLKDQEDSNV